MKKNRMAAMQKSSIVNESLLKVNRADQTCEKSMAENVNDVSIRKDSSVRCVELLGLKGHADKLNFSYQ